MRKIRSTSWYNFWLIGHSPGLGAEANVLWFLSSEKNIFFCSNHSADGRDIKMILVRDIRDIGTQHASGTAPFYSFRQVAEAARVPQRPPPFLLGPAPADVLWDIFADIETPAAGCYAIEGAIVAPTGFAIKDGVALHGAAFLHPRHHVVGVSDRLNAEDLPVRRISGPVAVICGPAHETWGHWLTDFLPRLWVLQATGYDLPSLRFLLPPDLSPFAWTLLDFFGIGPDQCVIHDHWREIIMCELVLLPTGLRADNRFSTCFAAATTWWTSILRAAATTLAPNEPRLFLSRAGAPQERQMANRMEIEAAARSAGFLCVRPEDFNVAEQVALFSQARVLVGEYGSALHNSVFARPDAVVCGLRGTSRHPSFVQSGIATALGQQAAYVFGDTRGQDVTQRFIVAPRLFAKAIELLA
jgi:capsular polysaccharide biosynthesis protein